MSYFNGPTLLKGPIPLNLAYKVHKVMLANVLSTHFIYTIDRDNLILSNNFGVYGTVQILVIE